MSTTRPATVALDAADRLGQSFKAAQAALRRMRGRETRHPGELSYSQYSLLFSLVGHDALSVSELGDAASLTPASVTEMLDGLVAAGLVGRHRSERDRRVVLTSLTEHGLAVVEARRAQVEPRWRAALAGFSDEELVVAADVLQRLAQMFDEFAES